MKIQKNVVLTTPIFYSNGCLHLGHAYTGIFTDVLSKLLKLFGHDCFVTFGADEHGEKISRSAANLNLSPKALVDDIYQKTIDLWKLLDVDYDAFTRTSDQEHEFLVISIFHKFQALNLIYYGTYKGFYCVHCEEYFMKTQLKSSVCPTCLRSVQYKEEESYFFNVKKFEKWVLCFYQENKSFCYPVNKIDEIINNFLKPGLTDLSLSRASVDWGIMISDGENKTKKTTLYVWFDALFNYLTALNFTVNKNSDLFDKYWNNGTVIQIIGKEITRFHCLYWPMFLKALNLKLPDKIFVHQWITNKNEKMSKSKNNFVYCEAILNDFDVDALRYYIIRTFPLKSDHAFDCNELKNIYNSELVNEIGNLMSRSLKMLELYNNAVIPEYSVEFFQKNYNNVYGLLSNLKEKLYSFICDLELNGYLKHLLYFVKQLNKLITDSEPWKLNKKQDKQTLNNILGFLMNAIKIILYFLSPVLSKKVHIFYQGIFGENIDKDISLLSNVCVNKKISYSDYKLYLRKK